MTTWYRHPSVSAGRCHYCKTPVYPSGSEGARANPQSRATKDHVLPQIWGSDTQTVENIVTACFTCNQVKGHYPAEPFEYFQRQHGGTALFNQREFRKFIFGLALAGFRAAMRNAAAARMPPPAAPLALSAPSKPRDARGRYAKRLPSAEPTQGAAG